MPGGRRRPQVMDPSWKRQNPVSISVTLTVLVWASLCKKASAFTLTVPASVSVQRGLCIHIPCRFSYNHSKRFFSEKHYGSWFQKTERPTNASVVWQQAFQAPGLLVATSDNRQRPEPSFANRFRLTGDPEEGDCSFSILNAQLQDTGEYVFQSADSITRYIYLSGNGPAPLTLQILVTEFTEKPELLKSSTGISGEEAIVTCLVLGPCLKIEPEISWETVLTGNRTAQWSQQLSNGSWTYGSNFTYMPSPKDQGKSLTCQVWYPHIQKRVESTIYLDVAATGNEVTLFLVVLCLMKVVLCSLFFFFVFRFLNRRKPPSSRE